jgi:hypothetical protein
MTPEAAAGWIGWRHRTGQEAKPVVLKGAPEGTLEVVKANQTVVLMLARDRYGMVPPPGAIKVEGMVLDWPAATIKRVAQFVAGQGDAVRCWIGEQAERYWIADTDPRPALVSACRDLVEWQKGYLEDPVGEVVGLGGVMSDK